MFQKPFRWEQVKPRGDFFHSICLLSINCPVYIILLFSSIEKDTKAQRG